MNYVKTVIITTIYEVFTRNAINQLLFERFLFVAMERGEYPYTDTHQYPPYHTRVKMFLDGPVENSSRTILRITIIKVR